MAEPRVLVSEKIRCPCAAWHRPKIRIIDWHHIVPLSWDGPDTKANQIAICPNQHRLTHELLDLYKRRGGFVSSADRAKFPRFTQKLAKQGWDGYVQLHQGDVDG